MNYNRTIDSSYNSSRILIAGGNGFIGSHLAHKLIDLSVERLTILGRRSEINVKSRSLNLIEYIRLDLRNAEEVRTALNGRKFDYIFNCAGIIDQSNNHLSYSNNLTGNLLPTVNLIESINADGLRRFVQIGSNAEYGNAHCPQSASALPLPVSAYGAMKLAATNVVLAKSAETDMAVSVIRPFSIFGHGMSPRTFIAQAINSLKKSEIFSMTSGEQTRDFIAVQDVIEDILDIACSDECAGCIQNSCSGIELSLNRVVDFIRESYPAFDVNCNNPSDRAFECSRSAGLPWKKRSMQHVKQGLLQYIRESLVQ